MLLNIGGLVAAHSVKLLDRINNPDEPETRDAWWNEIRNEMRSHARAMGCNAVVGYSESTSIWYVFNVVCSQVSAGVYCVGIL
jgi:hypothetical protein